MYITRLEREDKVPSNIRDLGQNVTSILIQDGDISLHQQIYEFHVNMCDNLDDFIQNKEYGGDYVTTLAMDDAK